MPQTESTERLLRQEERHREREGEKEEQASRIDRSNHKLKALFMP